MNRSAKLTTRIRWTAVAPIGRIRWAIRLIIVACATLGAALSVAGSSTQPTTLSLSAAHFRPGVSAAASVGGRLDPRISSLALHHPSQPIEAIVQFRPQVSFAAAYHDAKRARGRVVGQLTIIRALALRLDAAHARRLAASPDVHSVSLNTAVSVQDRPMGPDPTKLQTTFNQSLGTPGLWALGGTGAHVGVAVIDTGVDGQLPDFRASTSGHSRVVATAVTNPGAQTVMDTFGHGTDVAGIIAGNGSSRDASDPLRGRYSGVAPDANLVSIKVSDEAGNATVLDVIYGLEFAIAYRDRYNIRVVNLALDSTAAQPYQTDPLDAAVEAAWRRGIVVVVAAGNRGTAPDAVHYAPANDPFVITVGAIDEHGSANVANHTIADWSSRGTTQDAFAKPDLYAPGAHIISDLAPGSAFASMCSACVVDGQYIRAGGTSMATPMIAGLVADLLQLHRNWTPDQVKGALTSSSVWSDSLPEVSAVQVAQLDSPPVADQNLTPSSLLGSDGSSIDYTKSSWSKSSWSVATGALSASFTKSSWSCSCSAGTGSVDPSKSSWSTTSWSTGSLGQEG